MGPMLIGGDSAPTLLDGQGYRKDFPALRLASVEQLDKGVLLKWTLPGESR
jgi:2,5-diamino-6-(ribosylamino)-4(3H)-pyrimidinone 5'-phosphate reductase